jgi:hypothetical protein
VFLTDIDARAAIKGSRDPLGLAARRSNGTWDIPAKVPVELTGCIDSKLVRELVEKLLQGGRETFELRRLKYGF